MFKRPALYHLIPGEIVLTGYAPDGDSVRFLPRRAHARALDRLTRASLLERSARDGSVQVRLEGIDAPELHYEGAAQPRGASARDALLAWLGVTDARYADDGASLVQASPARAPVTLLTNTVDLHGRPIGYLVRGPLHARGARCQVDAQLLMASANVAMLRGGHAYPLVYTSLAPVHRTVIRRVARVARRMRKGVWRDDRTRRGVVLHHGLSALGPEGALVFPKLFRRCVDYLHARRRAAHGEGTRARSFIDWLRGHGSGGAPSPDRVELAHAANVLFASLVSEEREHVSLAVDLLDLTFVEP